MQLLLIIIIARKIAKRHIRVPIGGGMPRGDYYKRLDSITTVINKICYYFLLNNAAPFRTCVFRNIVINNNKTVLYCAG